MSRTAVVKKGSSIKPKSPPSLLSRLQGDLDRMETMFEHLWPMRPSRFPEWGQLPSLAAKLPAVDVFEEGDDVIVKAEIPGTKKDEIEVNVTGSLLTISGQKDRKEEVKDDKYYRCERSYGSFSRSIELPGEVQVSKAAATFTDGVLEVRLPKTEDAKRKTTKLKIK